MRSEDEVLGFWARKKIFEKSVEKRGQGAKRFVFFEGPPTANGKPGIHHVEARAFKDVMVRYKTLQGFRVERRAGWDTHGLPVEIEAEKTLKLKSKKEIEEYGVAAFNEECKKSVWKYKSEWKNLTLRMGFWLDFENEYITFHNSYIESLWWIIKEFWQKKQLYEDKKVVPWCVRCGTGLSSHELAQGYKKVTDQSVVVRFRVRNRRASLFVWTTTPWTLPANVAAAVDPEGTYVTIDDRGEKIILIKEQAEKLFPDLKPLWEEKGKDLVGLEYEAPYPKEGMPYKIVGGDFILHDEGTGVVHIAPAFGEDDMNVARKEELPVYVTVDDEGRFTDEVRAWKGMFVKDANSLIIKDLFQKGLIWKEEAYTHDYPFCWRCDTPLIYLARRSWWVKVSAIRTKLVEANKKVDWHPAHLQDGRFGAWIKEAKDWAFSRERYWGTPLPIWKCKECTKTHVCGSLEELSTIAKTSRNTYILMRHGLAKSNTLNIGVADPEGDEYGLTSTGEKQVREALRKLKSMKIDLILSSDLLRTTETAEIVAAGLKVPVEYEPSLREIAFGEYERKKSRSITDAWGVERLTKKLPGEPSESWNDLKKRMYTFFKHVENRYTNKKILIVGHGDPLWFLEAIMEGSFDKHGIPISKTYLKQAKTRKVVARMLPRNQYGEVDLHKPFIDEIELLCPVCKGMMQRTPEVADVWFDSGAMPYASWHYPFEHKERIDKKISFPADYISEAIDQVRGWFYTLLVTSVLLGKEAPYKNVLSVGFVLDKQGKKMSKSRGNIVDPMKLFETYGVDAVRWYFFTVNQPWDDKIFDEENIKKAKRNFLDLVHNSLNFYLTYREAAPKKKVASRKHILDAWIEVRLSEVRGEMTAAMDSYHIVEAARLLERFVAEDLSRWYVRRSRERMRSGESLSVLQVVLREVAILAAPFTPYAGEVLYQALGGTKESVHLEDWPKKKALNKKLLTQMEEIRMLATRGLELRARAGIKIRQPLSEFTVKKTLVTNKKLFDILKEELNVKVIRVDHKASEEVSLDTTLTKELEEEGNLREMVRNIQEMRKQQGLHPKDFIKLDIVGSLSLQAQKEIQRLARVKSIEVHKRGEGDVTVGGVTIVHIKKI